MAKKRKKWNLNSRITSALRRIWFYSPQRRLVLKEAKLNGNKCAICKVPKDKLEVDHESPVVKINEKERNWHEYIERLMFGKLVCICENCHTAKTTIQREQRKKFKQRNKK